MITIGIAHDLFISSAALVRDGEVVSAIAEERLNRQKQYKGFPSLAVQECLRLAGAAWKDVAAISFGWNPTRHLEFPNYRQSNNARWRPEYLYAGPNMILGASGQRSGEWIEQILDGMPGRIQYVDHQLAHAANAFYLSGFERAAVFTADGRGEIETTYLGRADQQGFHKLGQVSFPHSLGLLYGAVTQFLGFKPDSDEWKVMALAAYGQRKNEFYQPMRALVTVVPESRRFLIDQRYFSFAQPEVSRGNLYSEDFISLFGSPRGRADEITQRHFDMACALQQVFEEVMTEMVIVLHRETNESRLVAAGGCFMNSVYNGRLTSQTPFKELFVSSCPDDSGIAVGAALLAYHRLSDNPKIVQHEHNYWGPSFDDEIEDTLKKYNLSFRRLDKAAATGAQLLVDGKLIGWFQGRMEFGQRALGNRSILADPRHKEVKDKVNSAIKYREAFRPFAPAILAERVHEYFEAEPAGKVPYMERVYLFKEHVRASVPGVVHEDGTGRLQTVEYKHNPRFYSLIKSFEELTGIPIVLNTSFNLNGEPIVCSPTDAIRTFYSCGLDALILGDYLLLKNPG